MSREPKSKVEKEAEILRIDSIRAKFLELDDEEDEVKYQTIMEYCIENETCFHDGEFPHCDENLGKYILKQWKKREKKKTKRALDPNYPVPKTDRWYRVVPHGPKTTKWTIWHPWNIPYEVFQSGLGNCGFMAALSAISAHKPIVEFVFRDLELNEHGVYQLRLCKDGEWKIITIDDWVPCIKGKMEGASLKAIGGVYHIWPALIEKAVAKLGGGYEALHGIIEAVAMLTITGAPLTFHRIEHYTERVDEFWKILMRASDRKHLMTCVTRKKKDVKGETKEKSEIARTHGFTIFAILEVGSHRMLRIRNPWGRSDWKGKWSYEWTGWTDETVLKLHVLQNTISGAFWMEFEDFIKYFANVTICRWRADWYEIRLNMVMGGLWDGRQKSIRITVPKACEISVTAIRPRTHSHSCYCTWISIYEANASPHEQQILYCAPVIFSTEDVHLQPGDYIILVSKFYYSAVKEERNVAIHSSIPISARFCDWDPMKMVGIVQKTVEKKGREVVRQRDGVSIKKYGGPTFVVVMAQNYTRDRQLHVHTRISKIEGAELSRGNDIFSSVFGDVIPPRSSQILLVASYIRAKKKDRDSMSIEYFLSKEKVTKVGRSNRAAHIPKIEPTDYFHHTIVME